MPTNLPPDYYTLEKQFRQAATTEEKIALLQQMYSVVPKHKGTDHLRADMRRRLAKLNQEAQSHKGAARQLTSYNIPRAGAGQVVFIGPPGTGKTSLLTALSGEVSPEDLRYPPTFEPAPLMMPFENIQVQLVDTPPLNREFVEPRLKDLLRRADLVVLVLDLHQDPIGQLEDTIRLLEDFKIYPRHPHPARIDEKAAVILPVLVAVNKCDNAEGEELYAIFCELMEDQWLCLPVSAHSRYQLQPLQRAIIEHLGILRVYTKIPGKEADHNTPFVFKSGSTLEDLAGRIHKDFLEKMKYARVWGKSVHDGQMVQRNYVLQDGDVVEIHI